MEIRIKLLEELRTRVKLYPRDASAYAATRKPKRKTRAIDQTLYATSEAKGLELVTKPGYF